ncbi:HD domain-containing protein [Tenacibaculum ovolyticum]|uniref:HD domain-containing protein n=1 Tax=Tenacibaculum ovolyticum TaxID=104270 RepID=UPI003BA93DCA
MKNLTKYNFYPLITDNKEVILRVISKGTIDENVSSIKVYKKGKWRDDTRVIKSFMNKYVTGWITKEDILDTKIVEEVIITGVAYRTILARNFALEKHKNQKYGIHSYEVHLTNVVNVLLHFGLSLDEDIILMSAWLHDVIEDSGIEKYLLSTYFGEEVTEIVELVSNQKDNNKTKEDNKKVTFERIATNQKAMIVKLADRITNVEFSLLHGNVDKIKKYKKEQPLIEAVFESKIITKIGLIMYKYLKELL